MCLVNLVKSFFDAIDIATELSISNLVGGITESSIKGFLLTI